MTAHDPAAPDPAAPDPAAHVAHAVRDAVLALPGVARLSGGVLGEVATYLPGERVAGVRVAEDGVHVHVVLTAAAATAIPATAAAVQAATRAAVPAGAAPAVHVHVDDVDPAGQEPRGSQVPPAGTGEDEG